MQSFPQLAGKHAELGAGLLPSLMLSRPAVSNKFRTCLPACLPAGGIGGHPTGDLGQPNTGVQTNFYYKYKNATYEFKQLQALRVRELCGRALAAAAHAAATGNECGLMTYGLMHSQAHAAPLEPPAISTQHDGIRQAACLAHCQQQP